LGHDVGDTILKVAARRINHCVRESDTVARLGGDEFVILLEQERAEIGARVVAQKVIDSIHEPIRIYNRELYITVSIGIAVYPDNGFDAATIFKNADMAMYEAKDEGRDNYQFFSQAMNERVQNRRSLESDLRKAIDLGQLELFFQPQIDLRAATIHGCEALLRWRHPEKGMIPPTQFIPIAEELGIRSLGYPRGDAVCTNSHCPRLA
jgi:predicted signal transduction protein with EAL and GGDEF domain